MGQALSLSKVERFRPRSPSVHLASRNDYRVTVRSPYTQVVREGGAEHHARPSLGRHAEFGGVMDLIKSHYRFPIHWRDRQGRWQSTSCDLEDHGVRRLVQALQEWTTVFFVRSADGYLTELASIIDRDFRYLPVPGSRRLKIPPEIAQLAERGNWRPGPGP